MAAVEVAAVLLPSQVTAAVSEPAAGAEGLVTLNEQLVVPRGASVGDRQLDTGMFCGCCPESVTATVEMVADVAAVFCTVTVPAT